MPKSSTCPWTKTWLPDCWSGFVRSQLTRNTEPAMTPSTDRWSAEFDSGAGLILYVVGETHRRIVILRVLHLF